MRLFFSKKKNYRVLARYLENKCDDKEKAFFEKKLVRNPGFAKEFEQMEFLWSSNPESGKLASEDRMWNLFKEKVDTTDQANDVSNIPVSSISVRKVNLRYAAMIIVLLAIPSLIYVYLQNNRFESTHQDAPVIQYSEVNVPFGNRYSLTLSDGSKILLDAGSYIRYPKKFTNNRVIDLRGEAYFEVARDEENPFVINANNARIAVLGTTFNVRAWQESEYVKVSVEEGLVSLKSLEDSLTTPVYIEKNQFSTLTNSGQLSEPQKFEDENHRNWMDNEIRFSKASVAEVLSQLERWYDYDFVVEDKAILNEQITVHLVKTNVPEVLQIIGRIIDADIRQEGNTVYYDKKTQHNQS